MPEPHSDDPVVSRSYSFALLVSSFLLVLSLAWALYDEMFGLRPWRFYQTRFERAYSAYLRNAVPAQREAEKAVRESSEFQKMEAEIKAAEDAAKPRLKAIEDEGRFIDQQLAVLTDPFQTARARVTALVYQAEIASSENSRKSRLAEVEAARKNPCQGLIASYVPCQLDMPTRDGKTERKTFSFDAMEQLFNSLRESKARQATERGEVLRPAGDLRKARDTFFQDKMIGLTPSQLDNLRSGLSRMDIAIRQINVGSAGLVDRCQSCHIAMDSKVVPSNLPLTKAALGFGKSTDAPFSSHPRLELLKIHDPERFGCSPCHGGNGRATSSIVKGHGRNPYWLWPLFYRENFESGCQQCHAADMVTEQAPVLNRGKELFRLRGCIGCHRFEGFDNEGEQLLATRQLIRQLESQKKEFELDIPRVVKQADEAADNATAQALYARADNLRVTISGIDARNEQLDRKAASLMREEKKTGPSLKEVRMKIRPEWIPQWLAKTHEFRPTTKMPQFRLQPDEVQPVAAFIWQSGVTGNLTKHAPGNASRGKELFETRGCMACHSIGEGTSQLGGDFAANLSRVGEKDNYDYLVRYIHNPRERTRPYCPFEKRDLGPEDYAKKNVPYVFDLEHSRCPNDGHQLQVQQPTVMPSLRLTVDDARDIASFLIMKKHADAAYPPAPYLDDAKLKDRGRLLVKNYGCAGCHEISTLEDETRIGTELTTEGSKPIERLDFARLTEDAKRGILPDGSRSPRGPWYDQKGFFEQKLANPAIYDQGKYKPNPIDRLRMPKPNITPADITALATFLLGSQDQILPSEYLYRPADQRRDVQDGWWIVTKYNCMGCHQVHVGQRSILQGLPRYQAENKDKLPPPLIGEGARVDPNWLARFLENPALDKVDTNRNGVRPYLAVRMPTFSFSENEIRKIVRFFEAMAAQAQPYLPPKVEPLTDAERSMARALFTHPAAPCLKCHATGVAAHDATATAPNFLLARERLRPAWTGRWITDPARIAPGTAMPSGLFRKDGDRWIFSGPLPPSLTGYARDHSDLLVRYMFQLTPEEQRSLVGR